MLEGMLLDTPYDLAEMSDLQRPNLLDNADFRSGIINQVNGSSYQGENTGKRTLTIDRWTVSSLKVDVGDDSVVLTNTGPVGSSWTQKLEKPITLGKTYTLFVDVKSMTEGCYAWGYTDKSGSYSSRSLQQGENIFNDITQGWLNVGISVPSGGSITINGLKLEQGNCFSGMPVWNETIELLKCQRYFQTYWRFPLFLENENYLSGFIPLNFSPTMAKAPTLEFKELLGTNAVPVSAKITKTNVYKTNIVNVEFDKAFGYRSGYVSFNAYADE